MPRRLIRLSLAFTLILSGEVWALGLGEVRLDSALNEPLSARIELLSATPEELESLTVAMASREIFDRYGIDKPMFLQDIQFAIIRRNNRGDAYIQLRSLAPITEPFVTFLVEATWSSGRLLREYTVLLDPPTFAPPVASQPAVQAPQRSTAADSGQIDRTPAEPQREETAARRSPPVTTRPLQEAEGATGDEAPVDAPVAAEPQRPAALEGDYIVVRGDTLWGIASDMRADSSATMSQTMLALFEANPDAFGGNINNLREGARLRLPSADEIYEIERGMALAEVQRQHDEWGGAAAATGADVVDTSPSLQLVPPDEEPVGVSAGDDTGVTTEPVSREQQILDEIAEIQAADVPTEPSLIEIRNNDLAALRQELAEIRGEPYEPPVDETVADDLADIGADDEAEGEEIEGLFPDRDELQAADESGEADADEAAADDTDTAAADDRRTTTIAVREQEPSLIDQVIGYVTGTVGMVIGGVIVLVIGILFWFMRRGRGDESDDSWNAALDSDSSGTGVGGEFSGGTENLRAPARDDESFVVEEQPPGAQAAESTIEAPVSGMPSQGADTVEIGAVPGETDAGSIEDTFSSETAVNLDESDPLAEADFHMAYGLYDQAADLINGALEAEPERTDLLTKLCETYFVWGNRDSFVDAAERLHAVVGDGDSPEWDKTVIMGQQIAADHELFAGAGVAGATKAVDLTFDSGSDAETGALDMELGDDADDDVIDLGSGSVSDDDDNVDFLFDEDESGDDAAAAGTSETIEFDAEADTSTAELTEGETVEHDFSGGDGTASMPSISDTGIDDALADSGQSSDATAEIDLDDLGLDLSGLDDGEETQVATLDDDDDDDEDTATETAVLDDTAATEFASLDSEDDDFSVTGTNESLADALEETGRNPQLDPDVADDAPTGKSPVVDVRVDADDDLGSTSEMRLASDETGQSPQVNPADDESLLDATGATQVIGDDFDIQTIVGEDDDDEDAGDADSSLGDDDATLLAGLDDDDDDGDYDFAKTEALPADAFAGDSSLDATGELPAVASTDVDLDLDDLTAALQVSELGDTVEQPMDDATVEQPRDDKTVEQPTPSFSDDETSLTQALEPDEMDGGLHEARTMTEVGTKLDLARAYVDMGDPAGAKSILEEVLDEGDEGQRQQAKQLLDSLSG